MFLSLLTILPLFHYPALASNPGYDGQFHVARITESFINVKNGGIFKAYPDLMTHSFGSFGYPQNIFYPLILFIPEIIIHLIVGNGYLAFLLFTFLCEFLIFISMFFCSFKISKNRMLAIIASLLYGLGHFTLSIIFFYRSLGGMLDFIFLPIVFYGVYQLTLKNYRKWWILAFGMSGVILSDLPDSLVIFSFIIFSLGLAFLGKNWKETVIKRCSYLIVAGIVTLLLTSFFIIPLVQNLLYIKDITVNINDLYSSSISIMDLILPKTLSSYAIGILGGIIIIGIIAFWTKLSAFFKYLSIELLLFIVLTSNVFPWQLLQHNFKFLQFTGRFLYVITFLIAFIGAKLICMVLTNKSDRLLIITILSVCGILAVTSINLNNVKKPAENGFTLVSWKDFDQNSLSCNTLDYLPKETNHDKDLLSKHSIPVVNKGKDLVQLDYSNSYNKIDYRIKTNRNYSSIYLPAAYYPGFHVYVNDKEQKINVGKNKLIKVKVNKGINDIQIKYQKTTIQKLTIVISILALISTLFYIMKTNKKSK
ncbi:YfhO family protein [Fructilactobacillus myrtifloralis]|uniref:YfhO family protein n=1 Tax=Fructilactobacillus myrtifloralis TaxID=2940301 RepID=A0ABY5BM24_9LACO|nr:YfhO family protein [Fructilactobacillus myrtifloralis]USS84733.1 YfhO family protein [Fructilactobacillus myrtifloralis]